MLKYTTLVLPGGVKSYFFCYVECVYVHCEVELLATWPVDWALYNNNQHQCNAILFFDWLLRKYRSVWCLTSPQSVAACLFSFVDCDFLSFQMLKHWPIEKQATKLHNATSNIIAKHAFHVFHWFILSTVVSKVVLYGVFKVFGNCEGSTKWQWFSKILLSKSEELSCFNTCLNLEYLKMKRQEDMFSHPLVTTKSRLPSTAECGAIHIEPWNLSNPVRSANRAN